jgi:two-component system chemotaxis response regulator CheB
MPQSALENVQIDYCVPLSDLAPLLVRLSKESAADESAYPVPEEMAQEVRTVEMETNALNEHEQVGKPSTFSCPECGGVLWEVQDHKLLRFRCRTGHAFSAESVLTQQADVLEQALWVALRTLEEKVSLSKRLADQARTHGREWLARNMEQRQQEAEAHATLLRKILETNVHGDLPEKSVDQVDVPPSTPEQRETKAGQ